MLEKIDSREVYCDSESWLAMRDAMHLWALEREEREPRCIACGDEIYIDPLAGRTACLCGKET